MPDFSCSGSQHGSFVRQEQRLSRCLGTSAGGGGGASAKGQESRGKDKSRARGT